MFWLFFMYKPPKPLEEAFAGRHSDFFTRDGRLSSFYGTQMINMPLFAAISIMRYTYLGQDSRYYAVFTKLQAETEGFEPSCP